jgi:ribosomal protein S11
MLSLTPNFFLSAKKLKKLRSRRKKKRFFFRFYKPFQIKHFQRKYTFWQVLFKGYVKYYFRQILLKTYRQKVYVRCQANNLFLSTILPHREEYRGYRLSAGLLEDYKGKKKKKKTYFLGYELAYLFGQTLEDYKVRNIFFFFKGNSAQKKGVYESFRKRLFRTLNFFDVTPISHNGTKRFGKRRL